MTTATHASWVGWFRSKGDQTWQKMAEGASEGETFQRLLAATADLNGGLVVLPAGEDPAAKPLPGPPTKKERGSHYG